MLPYSSIRGLKFIIGDGGDSNEQAHSGADEDIKQQAVEKKVGNSSAPKNKHSNSNLQIWAKRAQASLQHLILTVDRCITMLYE